MSARCIAVWGYRMKGVVLVVPCVEWLQVVGVVRDEDGEVSAVLHQELLMLRLEVTAPLEVKGQRQVNEVKDSPVYTCVKSCAQVYTGEFSFVLEG